MCAVKFSNKRAVLREPVSSSAIALNRDLAEEFQAVRVHIFGITAVTEYARQMSIDARTVNKLEKLRPGVFFQTKFML